MMELKTMSIPSSIFPTMADTLTKNSRQDSDSTTLTFLKPNDVLKSELSLHVACRNNSLEQVTKLIRDNVDINTRDQQLDRTALHWAAAGGHIDIIDALLSAGAYIEAVDKYGMSPLLWAAWFGHTDAVRLLVNNGANIFSTNMQGMSLLHCASQNNQAGVLQLISEILDRFDINAVEKHGKTALHLAAEKGHEVAVETLLEMKCDVNKKDKLGQTTVHIAAARGCEEILKKLLLFGVEIDDRNSEGCTALFLAAANGHQRIVNILLSCTADQNAENTKEMSPLMAASMNGHSLTVMVLLEHKSNVDAQNNQGNTALHLAALNNHLDVVQQLVTAHCDINIQNQRLQTPLHVAVENADADIVQALLLVGANLQLQEKTGKTALGLASRGSLIGIVDMIIKADRCQSSELDDASSSIECGKYHHCFYRTMCSRLSNTDSGSSSKVSCDHSHAVNGGLKSPTHDAAEHMKEILWKLSTKQLKPNDWKKLAKHWKFTDAHIKAVEHQYTGNESYKEHGYRLLLIWLHGLKKDDNPMKQLFEALVDIERRELAEQVRKRCNVEIDKSTSVASYCGIS